MGSEFNAGRLHRNHPAVDVHIPMETSIVSIFQHRSNSACWPDQEEHVAFLSLPLLGLVFLASSRCYTCKVGTRVANSAADRMKLQFS